MKLSRFRVKDAIGLCGLLVAVSLLAGCSRWINDDKGLIVNRSDDYLDVPLRDGLEVPEDLSNLRVSDPFAIPEIVNSGGTTYPKKAPRPVPIIAGAESKGAKIQKLGDRRWLVLSEPPSVVWPKLKQFLAENGVDSDTEEALRGRITTGWVEVDGEDNRDVVRLAIAQAKSDSSSTGGRDRVNFSVEQGLRENTTEIHVRHQNDVLGSDADVPDDKLLSIESAVVAVEESILRELGGYLASEVSSQSVSRAGQDLVGSSKAELSTATDGQPILRLNLDFDRAWASITQALDKAEVEVTDLDRSEGILYVDLPEALLSGEPEKRGFLGRKRKGALLAMQILVLPASTGGYQVRAVDKESSAIDPSRAREVLNLIREYAI